MEFCENSRFVAPPLVNSIINIAQLTIKIMEQPLIAGLPPPPLWKPLYDVRQGKFDY